VCSLQVIRISLLLLKLILCGWLTIKSFHLSSLNTSLSPIAGYGLHSIATQGCGLGLYVHCCWPHALVIREWEDISAAEALQMTLFLAAEGCWNDKSTGNHHKLTQLQDITASSTHCTAPAALHQSATDKSCHPILQAVTTADTLVNRQTAHTISSQLGRSQLRANENKNNCNHAERQKLQTWR